MHRLRDLVAGRTVAVCAHGASIRELAARAPEFADLDFCYASLNYFSVIETEIVARMGRQLEIVYCTSGEEAARRRKVIMRFLARSRRKALITCERVLRDRLGRAMRSWTHQTVLIDEPEGPRSQWPNSMTGLLLTLMGARATSKIITFGLDGYLGPRASALDTYVGQERLRRERRAGNIVTDTVHFNAHWPAWRDAYCARHDVPPVEVLNCSPKTVITPIPVITYDELRTHAAPVPTYRSRHECRCRL